MISRRGLLGAASLPLFAAARAPRVERLETFTVKVNRLGNWVLVRVTTADGIRGVGEASHGGNDGAVVRLLALFFERLAGRSIWDLERFRDEMLPEVASRGRNAAVAYSALEQCLWDIRGKAVGLPVYELLGGRLRESIRNYANINRSTEDRTPEGFARMAAKATAAGFDAVKLAPFDGMPRNVAGEAEVREHLERGVACAAAVRAAVGEKRDVLIDVHNHFDLRHGLELVERVAPLRLYWLEETTPRAEDLAAVRRTGTVPTAGGENLFGVSGFYPYIAAGAVDIVMPDIKYCGGVSEMRKIAAMAEGAGLGVSPHGPASPVGNAVAAHVCATLRNFRILEFSFGEVPWRAELIDPPESVAGGCLAPPSRPGFGIELNEKAIGRYRV